MRNFAWMLCLMSLTGCFHQVVKEPGEITLVDAMKQVGEGFTAMRDAQGDLKTGLIAESAEVTFKITADSKNTGKLKIDLNSAALVEGVSAGGELGGDRSSSRSNTVTVKFKNLLLVPKDTVGYSIVGAELAALSREPGSTTDAPKTPAKDSATTPQVSQAPGAGLVRGLGGVQVYTRQLEAGPLE